jgi:uroporphyrinogen-III decarboxylase
MTIETAATQTSSVPANQEEALARYEAKMKRIQDAIALREPDRVPLFITTQMYPAYLTGAEFGTIMRDYDECAKCYDKFFETYDPDMSWDPVEMFPLKAFDTLGLKYMMWPGHGTPDTTPYQYVEDEYMEADEYDALIADPTGYMMNTWAPRAFENLAGLKYLKGFPTAAWLGFFNSFVVGANPEVQKAFDTLVQAGNEIAEWYGFLGEYDERMKNVYGTPNAWGGFGYPPFDMLANSMRGTIEVLMDMHEQPDKVLAAMDALLPYAVQADVAACKATGNPFSVIWFTKCIEMFMSLDDFKEFYWPTTLKLIEALVENDVTPVLYLEGSMDSRLETIRQIPAGKCIVHLEQSDIGYAKKVLGDVACIAGNMPVAKLISGTPDDVRAEVKRLIDTCAEGGGYIMDTDLLIDNAKPENVKAYEEATREFGVY